MNDGPGSFVWVWSQRGPACEKWPADMPAGGRTGKEVLAEHRLSAEEFALSMYILEQRYPPPGTTPPPAPAPAPRPKSPAPPASAEAAVEPVE